MKFSSRDLHIHTSLSSCAARTADASGYIAAAARGGLELIGFANHYWDEAVPGASGWYDLYGLLGCSERAGRPACDFRM